MGSGAVTAGVGGSTGITPPPLSPPLVPLEGVRAEQQQQRSAEILGKEEGSESSHADLFGEAAGKAPDPSLVPSRRSKRSSIMGMLGATIGFASKATKAAGFAGIGTGILFQSVLGSKSGSYNTGLGHTFGSGYGSQTIKSHFQTAQPFFRAAAIILGGGSLQDAFASLSGEAVGQPTREVKELRQENINLQTQIKQFQESIANLTEEIVRLKDSKSSEKPTEISSEGETGETEDEAKKAADASVLTSRRDAAAKAAESRAKAAQEAQKPAEISGEGETGKTEDEAKKAADASVSTSIRDAAAKAAENRAKAAQKDETQEERIPELDIT